ncbi:MAG: molybdopterin molybdotransferase MoeA [Nitrospirae bacterium]|nr:molybdopterin molybdotransferase MoeA [Nitrospirota bacterium]
MISVDEALARILQNNLRTAPEECLLQSALGRILANDILALHDQPPWDNSAMDGYALQWEDIRSVLTGNPASLKIVEVIPAGHTPRFPLSKGECAKIMTGAQVPFGADTVVPVEVTDKTGEKVLIQKIGGKGDHIRRKGEDFRKGEVILNQGKKIRPAEIAMLASLGKGSVSVFKKPKVAVLSTGDELAELNEPRAENKIYNSNGHALCAQVLEAGGEPLFLGVSPDSKDALLRKIQEGSSADILVISGGVSMGDFDYVKEVLTTHGKMNFWRVAMRPGAPFAFGEFNGKPFFGLPGNPVSCMVTFKLLVEPFLKKMGGAAKYFPAPFNARLTHEIRKKKGLRTFLRGLVFSEGHEWRVKTTGEQGSHLIHSMVEANCLMDLPEHLEKLEDGAKVSLIPFDF